VHKTGLAPSEVEQLIFGCVIAEPRTSNVAREVSLAAGLPKTVAAYTVSEACISANQAIANASDQIARGNADVVIAGGTDITSDVPIRYSKRMRQKLIRANKAKGLKDYFEIFKDVRPRILRRKRRASRISSPVCRWGRAATGCASGSA